ncbi:hypothetical protein ACFWGP_07985 [Agromyces sp. NPDC127015]|uniref:hypothetical protein n=1 Tax=Agromyces sp. NPDC127015 TaxID=3347108 RepID=UPI0036571699
MRSSGLELFAGVVATAVLVAGLAGCTPEPAPAASPDPTAAASPEPVATPLECDDLVAPELVAATLEGGDGTPVEPVAAAYEHDVFTGILLEGVGGLPCSWRVGSGMPEYGNGSDWAYLRVDVLPGAAGEWQPEWAGDAPSTDTRDVAGITASIAAGDSGWRLSAPVGDAWVRLSISAAGLTGAGSRFLGVPGGDMLDRLAAAAEPVFTSIAGASPEQLAWPAMPSREGEAACTGGLDEQGIVAAEQLPDGSAVEYTTVDATTAPVEGFTGAVEAAARAFDCDLVVDGGAVPLVSITTARGFGPLFERLREPDGDVAFEPIELADVPAGSTAEAVVRGYDDGPSSPAYLVVGDSLYRIQGDGASAVAQAIVHQTY